MASWTAGWPSVWQFGLQSISRCIERTCSVTKSKLNHFFAHYANVFRAACRKAPSQTAGIKTRAAQCQFWLSKCYPVLAAPIMQAVLTDYAGNVTELLGLCRRADSSRIEIAG